MKIAALGDLHYTSRSAGLLKHLLNGMEGRADVLVLAGDLTNMGRMVEIELLIKDLRQITIPIIAVVGNHDHESDQQQELVQLMEKANVCVLDCTSCVIEGIGFVGSKGFCGGFGERMVSVFGERAIKSFVQESISETERLARALASMTVKRRVAVLHYGPVKGTLAGEPEEIIPFLGTSRLAEVLDQYGVDMIFHGHAHHGRYESKTPGGIPVYNVARFVLAREGEKPFRIFEM
ncbi:MAG: metallophosphoesterase [Desulfobacterales bacterium]